MTYDGLPQYPPRTSGESAARCEHAFLLRCEGLTLREIGRRLDISPAFASDLVKRFPRAWLNRAMRKTHFRWIREDVET